ncbi:melanopsin-A-like [Cynoglossus semilaevis]|uniref:melanopsin-A-like n=1 Tax=Cynoglossus semilaevis TaxID=244447 RepID=UPI000D62F7D7|nr:melanopsin-A-like [Cynoglossus semilaevis]
MRLDYNGHQTSGRSWQVDSPNGNFKPCCPLAAWSQRKPKYRAASSTRWTYLTTFTTPSWCLSLSLGRWASWSTLWLFLPSIGSYIPEVLMTSCTWEYVTYTWSNRSYTMMLCCFVFFIPMGIILFCYILMFLAVKKTGRKVGRLGMQPHPAEIHQ